MRRDQFAILALAHVDKRKKSGESVSRKFATTFLLCGALAACSGASAEQIERAKEECVSFYEKERMGPLKQVEALDTWEKEGKLVVELAERPTGDTGSSYTQELCVVDFENGEMELPSAFERGRWDE